LKSNTGVLNGGRLKDADEAPKAVMEQMEAAIADMEHLIILGEVNQVVIS